MRRFHEIAIAIVCLSSLLDAASADAQRRRSIGRDLLERFSPDVEIFGARNMDSLGQDGFSFGGGAAVHVEINIIKSLGVHGGGNLFVLGKGDLGKTVFFFGSQAGLRFHWSAFVEAVPGDAWIDIHHAYGRSGNISRHGADAGIGYGYPITPTVTIGPFVRLDWLSDPGLSDPWLLSFGVELSLMSRERLGEEITDSDGDGIADWDDMCPDQSMGRHADPTAQGCPARDRDGDGLVDPLDECPSETMWPYPNPDSDGCPLPDRDADGIPDVNDLCPDTFAPDGGDPLREGCIEGDEPY